MESDNVSTLREAKKIDPLDPEVPLEIVEEQARIYDQLFGADDTPPPPPGRAVIETPPAPTGGGHPFAVAYYFTANVGTEADPIYQTCVREIAIPFDATVECIGNTLVVRHEGVADTFRIGRVRPLEA